MHFPFRSQRMPLQSEAQIRQIRDRVQAIHNQVGQEALSLVDIFTLVGEDDSMIRARRGTAADTGKKQLSPAI